MCSWEVFATRGTAELVLRGCRVPGTPRRDLLETGRRDRDARRIKLSARERLGPFRHRFQPCGGGSFHPSLQTHESLYTKGTGGFCPAEPSYPRPTRPTTIRCRRPEPANAGHRSGRCRSARPWGPDSQATRMGRLEDLIPSNVPRIEQQRLAWVLGSTEWAGLYPARLAFANSDTDFFGPPGSPAQLFHAQCSLPTRSNPRSLTQPKPNHVASCGTLGLRSTPSGRAPNGVDDPRNSLCRLELRNITRIGQST